MGEGDLAWGQGDESPSLELFRFWASEFLVGEGGIKWWVSLAFIKGGASGIGIADTFSHLKASLTRFQRDIFLFFPLDRGNVASVRNEEK